MAFSTTTQDSSLFSEAASIPPSFITANDEDPFSLGNAASVIYPDAKRNILDDINNAEFTFLPQPSQKENLAVFLRVKPRTEFENNLVNKKDEIVETVRIESEFQVALFAPKESATYKNSANGVGQIIQRYSFTKIFNPQTNQQEIFANIVCPKVKDFLEGQNQLLFTYGATSAGKTYTLQGVPGDSGVMPRAIDTIFCSIEDRLSDTVPLKPSEFNRVVKISKGEQEQARKEKEAVYKLGLELLSKNRDRASPDVSTMSACSGVSSVSSVASSVYANSDRLDLNQLGSLFPGLSGRDRGATKLDVKHNNITYTVWISFAEIYNENIYDLLRKVPESKKKGEKVKRTPLKLSDDRNGSTFIKGLREIQVMTADEAYQALMIGRENLHFAATRLNQQSSRSHCIFTIKLVRVADPNSPHMARVSILSFCDLAGSERISKTHNVGERQKEAGNINTSLLVLGRCIKAIRHNQSLKEKKGLQVVPFRESKLTRMFKSFFTGLGKSSLIVCISQAQYLFDESVHVCKFASIASKVTVETIKEPPPKKARKKSSRFVSLLEQSKTRFLSGNSILSGRGSIAWEVPPRKKSSLLPGTFNPNARSTILGGAPPRMSTLINISEMEEGGGDADETGTALDNTVVQTQYESLLGLVEDLKKKLIEERRKNQTQEKQLREELCEEFNIMLVEVETGWEKRLEAEREDAEKMNEWRLGELQSVHRNRNKRRRGNDSGDFQAEVEAHRLQTQIDTKDKEVLDLCEELEENRRQMAAMKETTIKSKHEQDKLQCSNSTLKFELAEKKRLVVELEKEVESLTAKIMDVPSSSSNEDNNAVLALQRSLASVNEELEKRDEEISDLKDLLQEAGDEFVAKEEESKRLEKDCREKEASATEQSIVIQDLQAQLAESHALLQEVNNQLEEKEQRVEEMEEEAEKVVIEASSKDETISKLRRQVGELEGQVRLLNDKYQTAEQFSSEMKDTLLAAEKVAEDETDRAKEAEEKMLEAQGERNQLLSVKSKLIEQLAELKESKMSNSQELEVDIECFDLKQQVEALKDLNASHLQANESLKKQNDEQRKEIEELKTTVDELKTSNPDESMFDDDIEELKSKVETLEKEKRVTEESLHSSTEEMENLKHQLMNLKKELESDEMVDMESSADRILALQKEVHESKEENSACQVKIEEGRRSLCVLEEKVKDLEEQLDASEKLMEDFIEDNEKEKVASKTNLDYMKTIEANLKNELKDLNLKYKSALDERDQITRRVQELEASMKDSSSQNDTCISKIRDLETNTENLKKDEATKDSYIKQLEDIIVEKEYQISQLEEARISADSCGLVMDSESRNKLRELETEKSEVDSKLKTEYEVQKNMKIQIEELTVKVTEMSEVMAHQEKVKKQRDEMEKRLIEYEASVAKLQESKEKVQASLTKYQEENIKLRSEVDDAKSEVKDLRRATKNSAKEAQEAHEAKTRIEELHKEISRLNSVVDTTQREETALDILKSELESKSKDVSQTQEKVERLRTELGAKDLEVSSLQEKVDMLKADVDAKEYDVQKTKEDRDKLMQHYELIFKKKQEELDSIKAIEKEKVSLGEIISKATPSKQAGELKEKLARTRGELAVRDEKLQNAEDQISELKNELKSLHKQYDSRIAQHERETNRNKLASQKVIAEYKETNKVLLKQVDTTGTSSPAAHNTSSPTLEADDSKTDNSLIEVTPVVKKGRGRGKLRGGSRTNKSGASLASFEDSNTENDPEVGRPRAESVSRKGRVTKKGKSEVTLTVTDVGGNERSVSRKRTVASRSDASVLREKQLSVLSPVPEGERSGSGSRGGSLDFSGLVTPALKNKKRRLCSMTPQHSEVFTPPTDVEGGETPGSVVKRQLRTRSKSKK